MTVVINELGMAQYFQSQTGPLGRYIGRRADIVRDSALSNAQGPIINVDTTDLISSTKIQLTSGLEAGGGFSGFISEGVKAIIYSDAEHRDFNYPAVVTRATFATPGGWLIQALRDNFQVIRRKDGIG